MAEERIRADLMAKSDGYLAYVMAYLDPTHSGKGPLFWQAIRKSLLTMLDDHRRFISRHTHLFDEARASPPLPYDVAELLIEALRAAADGDRHPLLAPHPIAGGRGNRKSGRKLALIETAVDYLTLVDLGLIQRRASRDWVAGQLGVSRRQVFRWLRAAGSIQRRRLALESRYPVRKAMPAGLWEQQTPRLVEKLLAMRRDR